MSYNPNIPQATDRPSVSQGQFLTNFQQLNTVFSNDHVAFNNATVANRGKHKKVTLISSSTPTTDPTDLALYSQTVGGVVKWFFMYPNTGSIVQLSLGTAPLSAASGYTWLAGGMMMQWDKVINVPVGTSGNISFPVAFASTPYSITCTFSRSATSNVQSVYVLSGSVNLNNFKMVTAGTTTPHDVYYIAIGPGV